MGDVVRGGKVEVSSKKLKIDNQRRKARSGVTSSLWCGIVPS